MIYFVRLVGVSTHLKTRIYSLFFHIYISQPNSHSVSSLAASLCCTSFDLSLEWGWMGFAEKYICFYSYYYINNIFKKPGYGDGGDKIGNNIFFKFYDILSLKEKVLFLFPDTVHICRQLYFSRL